MKRRSFFSALMGLPLLGSLKPRDVWFLPAAWVREFSENRQLDDEFIITPPQTSIKWISVKDELPPIHTKESGPKDGPGVWCSSLVLISSCGTHVQLSALTEFRDEHGNAIGPKEWAYPLNGVCWLTSQASHWCDPNRLVPVSISQEDAARSRMEFRTAFDKRKSKSA